MGTGETVGKYLRSEREKQNISKESLSKITRIRLHYINAIESDEFSDFPSLLIIRGYIKYIASAIKADETYALRLFDSVAKNWVIPPHKDIVKQKMIEERRRIKVLRFKILIAVLIIILFFAFFYLFTSLSKKFSGHKISLNGKSLITSPFHKNGVKERIAGIKDRVILKGSVVRRTWIEVVIDNKKPSTYMLYPGTIKLWKAKRFLWIKIGNAGGIHLTYNGKRLGKLGHERQVITLSFPKK